MTGIHLYIVFKTRILYPREDITLPHKYILWIFYPKNKMAIEAMQ